MRVRGKRVASRSKSMVFDSISQESRTSRLDRLPANDDQRDEDVQ